MVFMILLPLFRLFIAAIYQNVDNFALAAAYRIKNVAIPWRANLLIAFFSGLATGAAVISGYVSGQGIDAEAEHLGLGSISEKTGRGILIMIGVWIMIGYFRSKLFRQLGNSPDPANPANAERTSAESKSNAIVQIRRSESFVVAVALAADNLGPSFFLGWAGLIRNDVGLSALVLFGLTVLCSVVAVSLGQLVGERGRLQLRFFPAELVSAVLIIGIGLFDSDAVVRNLIGRQ
jgi:putative Mn2+ efflux pump MntP